MEREWAGSAKPQTAFQTLEWLFFETKTYYVDLGGLELAMYTVLALNLELYLSLLLIFHHAWNGTPFCIYIRIKI